MFAIHTYLEIDQKKRDRQVDDIVETETFQKLQQDAKAIRKRWEKDR
jgi:hypothetical protein